MKKKLLIVTMIFALAVALVGGATFALFTGSASNDANTFSAGTVTIDIQRNAGEPVPGPMFYTTLEEGMGETWQTEENFSAPKYATGLWAPGDSHKREMTVKNVGSLPVKLARLGAKITGDSAFLNDEAAMEEFKNNLIVRVEAENGTTELMYEGTLSEFMDDGVAALYKPVLGPKVGNNEPTQHLNWICTLSPETGNPMQGQKPVVSFYLIAEQAKNN